MSQKNIVKNIDCIEGMGLMPDNSVDFTLTDIPYNAVSRVSNGLRLLDKGNADIMDFDLKLFLNEVYRISKNAICIFCGKEQFSEIYAYFADKKGTVRPIIWEKTNPSPMNGQYVYLSGIEMAVWFKKAGAKGFHAFCKNTVFRFPSGRREIHPTQKNIALFRRLISDNTDIDDLVFDPCMGSGTTAVSAFMEHRYFYGFEKNKKYFDSMIVRLVKEGAISTEIVCG